MSAFRDLVRARLDDGGAIRIAGAIGCDAIPAAIAGEERGGNHALVFERVAGVRGTVVGNFYGATDRVCAALGTHDTRALFERYDAAAAAPRALERRSRHRFDGESTRGPDLARHLPAIRHSRDDATAYLMSGILVARDPADGRHHLCFVRMALAGGDRVIVNPATARIRDIVGRTVGAGEELPVAILVGAPAAVTLAACVTAPVTVDKYAIAQSYAGDELAYSDDPVPIPLTTEVALLGRIVPDWVREGPVGDQKGLYSLKERNPVCVVDEIRVRHGVVHHVIAGGVSAEHVELVTLGPRAVLERLRRGTPGLVDYRLPRYAGGRLAVLVVEAGFDPRTIAERLWSISSVRGFVAVNRDVDAGAADAVLWSIVERAKSAEHFDFSGDDRPGVKPGKFLIDATERDLADWNHRRIEVLRPAADSEPG
ncbi:MAG: UbiD family decarboxylase [Burkholderiales bacterium]|nr:UbiD family decarboxylase [Burkholderiales bacterium]